MGGGKGVTAVAMAEWSYDKDTSFWHSIEEIGDRAEITDLLQAESWVMWLNPDELRREFRVAYSGDD